MLTALDEVEERVKGLNLGADDRPEQLRALAVTPSFFRTLGRLPAQGRGFVDAWIFVAGQPPLQPSDFVFV